MSIAWKRRVFLWVYGLVGGIVGGIATTILSIGGSMVDGSHPFTPRQLQTVAVMSAIVSGAAYLKQHPTPDLTDDDDTPGAPHFTNEHPPSGG